MSIRQQRCGSACQIYAKRQMNSVPAGAVEAELVGDRVLEKILPLLALVMKFAHETRKIILARGRVGMSPRPIFRKNFLSTLWRVGNTEAGLLRRRGQKRQSPQGSRHCLSRSGLRSPWRRTRRFQTLQVMTGLVSSRDHPNR